MDSQLHGCWAPKPSFVQGSTVLAYFVLLSHYVNNHTIHLVFIFTFIYLDNFRKLLSTSLPWVLLWGATLAPAPPPTHQAPSCLRAFVITLAPARSTPPASSKSQNISFSMCSTLATQFMLQHPYPSPCQHSPNPLPCATVQ